MNKIDATIHEAIENIDVPDAPIDFFEQLEREMANISQEFNISQGELARNPFSTRMTKSRRRILAAIAVPVAAAVLVGVLISIDSTNNEGRNVGSVISQPPVAGRKITLASYVIDTMKTALTNVTTLRADATFTQYPYSLTANSSNLRPGYTAQGEIRLRNDGQFFASYTSGQSGSHGPQMDSYDARVGTTRSCWELDKQWHCNTSTGVIPTDPVAWKPLDLGVMSAMLRNAVATDSQTVQEVTFDRRPAWRLTATFPYPGVYYADAATITVDQETGLAVSVLLKTNDQPFSETTLHNLQINTAMSEADFVLTPPTGAQMNPPDARPFARTTIDQVQSQVGYAPFQPTLKPGWVLQEVSIAKSDGNKFAVANPEGKDVVALTYRRGLESATFLTQRRGSGTWITDPLYSDGDGSFGKTSVTLTTGAFAGTSVTADTLLSSQHLWGVGNSFVLAIAGDLTQDEMIEAANSLHN